jgi:hypothetical protein
MLSKLFGIRPDYVPCSNTRTEFKCLTTGLCALASKATYAYSYDSMTGDLCGTERLYCGCGTNV